jgi:hypothetical protein
MQAWFSALTRALRALRNRLGTKAPTRRFYAMMTRGKTTLERAFEIASAGKVTSLSEIQQILKLEGFDATHVTRAGPLLKRQLNLRIWSARPEILAQQKLRNMKRRLSLSFNRSLLPPS